MRSARIPHFERSFRKLPLRIRKAFEKQHELLLKDIRHPSLRAKKYDESAGVWQARVTNNVRFYFTIEEDIYYLIDIEKHKD